MIKKSSENSSEFRIFELKYDENVWALTII